MSAEVERRFRELETKLSDVYRRLEWRTWWILVLVPLCSAVLGMVLVGILR